MIRAGFVIGRASVYSSAPGHAGRPLVGRNIVRSAEVTRADERARLTRWGIPALPREVRFELLSFVAARARFDYQSIEKSVAFAGRPLLVQNLWRTCTKLTGEFELTNSCYRSSVILSRLRVNLA